MSGNAVFENNMDVKRKAFDDLPVLANIYQTCKNPTFVVFYIAGAEVTFYSMTGEIESGKF
ncbi:MAG: hypothetical protein LBU65_12985 [Planctomycetaceae bacterium]|nr:hypothetical protein [Planctomycetaceae bacterium]